MAPLLLDYRAGLEQEGDAVDRTTWLWLGAVVLGAAIVLYLVFFCPTECH
ncbi:hypothetical protein [Nitrospira sp. Kam-Ns4a]